jgi:selenide,water dikinase
MTTLNKSAAELLARNAYPVHAMTDVTGFGLIGHARELALASKVSLELRAANVPVLPGALACVRAGHVPGGLKANRDFAECMVEYSADVPADLLTLLFDPQTAGGLLISVSAEVAHDLVAQLREIGLPVAHIGDVRPSTKPVIQVL